VIDHDRAAMVAVGAFLLIVGVAGAVLLLLWWLAPREDTTTTDADAAHAATLTTPPRLSARCPDCHGRFVYEHPANRDLGRAFHQLTECAAQTTANPRKETPNDHVD